MRFWLQLILIPLLALVGAGVSALWVERPAPEERQTDAWARTAEQVAAMPSVLWVDARPAAQYETGRLDGAINVSLDSWEAGFEALIMDWEPDSDIVVYCDGEGCQLSRETAERLRRELGSDRVFWLEGGIQAWENFKP